MGWAQVAVVLGGVLGIGVVLVLVVRWTLRESLGRIVVTAESVDAALAAQNGRLDAVRGRLDDHEQRIGRIESLREPAAEPMRR